ncbi:O-antigen/teichoic acid export membrane protein [Friedmanniella endophytica]|uniref:O-antigen/teichoic acid export membrane protein n=1 Tax=Microlunatus kandeliicorticis TaxID=1759536 RepID=A0A7W3IQ87_9ACTN|nr:hypothetical protein [Microlunatus kandeliicorticis]MBA8793253.1 O-antigen/teichoic acid export membrane protein [Microlunatus kandeliicorticis]
MKRALAPSRLLGRIGGNVVDQVLSALSNVALSIVVARSVDAHAFGAFSIAFLVFGIAIAVTRAVVGQPLQIAFSAQSPEVVREAAARAFGFALLAGMGGALISLGVGAALGGQTGLALIALAPVLPGLLVQDSCRMCFFALGRAWHAALIDGVWTVLQFCALAVLVLTATAGLGSLVLAWGLAGTVAGVLGLIVLRVVPRPARGISWLVEQRELSRFLFAEYVIGLGAMQLAILIVGAIVSANAVGSLRAAQVLLGPLGVVGAAVFQFAVPEIARRPELDARRRGLFGLGISGVLGTITAVYLVVLLLIPDRWGSALFGDSWAGAALVLLPMGLSSLASSLANGPAGVLYGMGQAQRTFRINLIKGPILLATVIGGAYLWAETGAAWALALTEAVVLPLWLLALRRALAAPVPAPREPLVQAAG